MSTIGSTSAAGMNFAGSIVGSSRPEMSADQSKAAADQKSLVDQSFLAKMLGDVADTEFASERDADGRMLYRRPEPPPDASGDSIAADYPPLPVRTAADAYGDRGTSLDIEA